MCGGHLIYARLAGCQVRFQPGDGVVLEALLLLCCASRPWQARCGGARGSFLHLLLGFLHVDQQINLCQQSSSDWNMGFCSTSSHILPRFRLRDKSHQITGTVHVIWMC